MFLLLLKMETKYYSVQYNTVYYSKYNILNLDLLDEFENFCFFLRFQL